MDKRIIFMGARARVELRATKRLTVKFPKRSPQRGHPNPKINHVRGHNDPHQKGRLL